MAIFASDSKIQMQHHNVFGPIVKYEKKILAFSLPPWHTVHFVGDDMQKRVDPIIRYASDHD